MGCNKMKLVIIYCACCERALMSGCHTTQLAGHPGAGKHGSLSKAIAVPAGSILVIIIIIITIVDNFCTALFFIRNELTARCCTRNRSRTMKLELNNNNIVHL